MRIADITDELEEDRPLDRVVGVVRTITVLQIARQDIVVIVELAGIGHVPKNTAELDAPPRGECRWHARYGLTPPTPPFEPSLK